MLGGKHDKHEEVLRDICVTKNMYKPKEIQRNQIKKDKTETKLNLQQVNKFILT